MVAVAQQRHQSAGDGTHAGGENQRGLAALKAGDDLAQRGAVGIAGADIGIALGSVGLLNLFETAHGKGSGHEAGDGLRGHVHAPDVFAAVKRFRCVRVCHSDSPYKQIVGYAGSGSAQILVDLSHHFRVILGKNVEIGVHLADSHITGLIILEQCPELLPQRDQCQNIEEQGEGRDDADDGPEQRGVGVGIVYQSGVPHHN